MDLSVPPKISLVLVIGYLKDNSVVLIHRNFLVNKRVSGLDFWSWGYCGSTVELDEGTIRKYVRDQEQVEKQLVQLDI